MKLHQEKFQFNEHKIPFVCFTLLITTAQDRMGFELALLLSAEKLKQSTLTIRPLRSVASSNNGKYTDTNLTILPLFRKS